MKPYTRRCAGCKAVVQIMKIGLVGWVFRPHSAGASLCGWSGEVVGAPRKKAKVKKVKKVKLTMWASIDRDPATGKIETTLSGEYLIFLYSTAEAAKHDADTTEGHLLKWPDDFERVTLLIGDRPKKRSAKAVNAKR